jgi:flavin reductase (DIM6/NTAB) family NADH-FMN oxidoreductase RutF
MVDDAQFKLAMSHFTSGVTVVTTEHDGTPFDDRGVSFASLSLDPPLVLVCIEKAVKTHDALAAAAQFGVSILAQSQADLSGRFASKKIDDKFAGVAVTRGEVLGVPLLEGAICALECRVSSALPGGDHTIRRRGHERGGRGAPLVYFAPVSPAVTRSVGSCDFPPPRRRPQRRSERISGFVEHPRQLRTSRSIFRGLRRA